MRLGECIQRDRRALEKPRRMRSALIRQYAGPLYSGNTSTDADEPINLLALYVSIVSRSLISEYPRVMIDTDDRSVRAQVRAMSRWVNKEIQRSNLQESLERYVLDALFLMGIMKVSLATPEESARAAWNLGAAQPLAQIIDFDDFVWDLNARHFDEVGYMGHRYRALLNVVKENKRFNKKQRDKLKVENDGRRNEDGADRIGELSKDGGGWADDAEDYIDLWEIYCPRHRKVYTLTEDQLSGLAEGEEPLGEQDWIGSDKGPYCILAYERVPGNAMPVGPLQRLGFLAETTSGLYRKLIRQANRQKELALCDKNQTEDAKTIQAANDGDVVCVNNPESIVAVSHGTVNDKNMMLADYLRQQFNKAGVNLDMVGGLEAQSRTATQDKMLNENSSRAIIDMQARTVCATTDVVERMCWYWWKDPQKYMESTISIQGLPEIKTSKVLGPEQRSQIPFEKLNITVDPYSLQHQTPESKINGIIQTLTQVYMPMSAQAQAQGVMIDYPKVFKLLSELRNQPDLADVLTIVKPPETEGSVGESKKPPVTERKYTRENVPMRTDRGDSQNLRNSLMGVNPGGDPRKNGKPAGA